MNYMYFLITLIRQDYAQKLVKFVAFIMVYTVLF